MAVGLPAGAPRIGEVARHPNDARMRAAGVGRERIATVAGGAADASGRVRFAEPVDSIVADEAAFGATAHHRQRFTSHPCDNAEDPTGLQVATRIRPARLRCAVFAAR